MKILNREQFLEMPSMTVYMKVLKGCQGFCDMEIKLSDNKDGWGNDWVADSFFVFLEKPFDEQGAFPSLGDTFSFSREQSCRDGLFETDELYAVFEKADIAQVIEKLKICMI